MDKEGVEGSQDIFFLFLFSRALSLLGLELNVNSCGGISNCCGAEFFF
jgi:hypothetical protein